MQFPGMQDDAADSHSEISAAIATEIADRTGVHPTRRGLELTDDLHGADFRRTGHRATGKGGAEDVDKQGIRAQPSRNGGDQLVHGGKAANREEFFGMHGAWNPHTGEIVAH